MFVAQLYYLRAMFARCLGRDEKRKTLCMNLVKFFPQIKPASAQCLCVVRFG
jgi:hypothetical protein